MRFWESPWSSGQVGWRKPVRKLPSRGSCSEALKPGMQGEWGSPAWFFASTAQALHLFLLLPLIFHSFDKYHLSPTMCRCMIKMDTPVLFSSPSFPFPFLPSSCLTISLSLLPWHPLSRYFPIGIQEWKPNSHLLARGRGLAIRGLHGFPSGRLCIGGPQSSKWASLWSGGQRNAPNLPPIQAKHTPRTLTPS